MTEAGIGAKVRTLRRREGLSQAQLAERLEISASYLNLIEHDKRPLTAPLLIKLAQKFEVDLSAFASDSDASLEANVREVLADPMFDDRGLVDADVREVARQSPLVARALVVLYGAWQEARQTADGLAERLSDVDEPALGRSHLSSEEVNDFIQRHLNYFPELEDKAEALWKDASLDSNDIGPGLKRWLSDGLGVSIRFEPAGLSRMTRRFDPAQHELVLSEVLPPRARHFQLAHQIALIQHDDVITRLARDERLTTDESRMMCRVALANYFAGAVLMPYTRMLAAAREVRYDVELLGHRFRTSWEQVTHRLTSLRRPGAEGVPFHLIRVDVAGNISKRFSASGIRFPRFAGVCARWGVFSSFQTPGLVNVQVSQMPDNNRYFCFSRAIRKEAGGYRAAHSVFAIGLGCPLEHARALVYSDGVDVDSPLAAEPIGVTCRTCERLDCELRSCPPLQHPLRIDPNIRGASLFAPVDSGTAPAPIVQPDVRKPAKGRRKG